MDEQRIDSLERENRELRERVEYLERSEERYHAIFEHSHVSIWEEDYSEIFRELQRLKRAGVEDVEAYLRSHPEKLEYLISCIKVRDVNQATLRLYNAGSKDELLGSLSNVFVEESLENFIEECGAISRGQKFYEGETVGKKLTGEFMHLLLRITVPGLIYEENPDCEDCTADDYSYVIVGIIDITDRKKRERGTERLLQQEKEQRNMAESLRTTTLAMAASMDTSEILDLIIDQCGNIASHTAANVCLFEDDEVRVVRLRGYERYGTTQEEIERIYNSGSLENVGAIRRTKRPVIVCNTEETPSWQSFPPTSWVKSFLSIPLIIRGEVIGMINFDSEESNGFTEDAAQRLEPFGNAAAVALENARLYQEARREVSERQHAEEQLRRSLSEKEVLLKEIHHRVKNNLNVVASLLNLQTTTIGSIEQAKEALYNSQNRVQSMSMVHESLYETQDLSSIDIGAYTERMAEELSNLYDTKERIRLELDTEELYFDINRAVPFGLILNEVLSNAMFHAFPGGQSGSIRISVRRVEDGAVWFRISDDGVGFSPDELDEEETLGLQLIRVLTEQIGGSFEVRKEAGMHMSFRFPTE
jgi:two-component sensor histidine kinase/PAS domain-containing protein